MSDYVVEELSRDQFNHEYILELATLIGSSLRNETLIPLRHYGPYESKKDRWHLGLCNNILDASVCGEVYTINRNQAIALVYPPGIEAKSSIESKGRYHKEYQKLAREEDSEHKDWVASVLFPRIEELATQAFGENGDKDSWSLTFLAVAEGFQGRGLGSALMEHIEEQARKNGDTIVLEASNLSNVTYYQDKLGYRLLQDDVIPGYKNIPAGRWIQFKNDQGKVKCRINITFSCRHKLTLRAFDPSQTTAADSADAEEPWDLLRKGTADTVGSEEAKKS